MFWLNHIWRSSPTYLENLSSDPEKSFVCCFNLFRHGRRSAGPEKENTAIVPNSHSLYLHWLNIKIIPSRRKRQEGIYLEKRRFQHPGSFGAKVWEANCKLTNPRIPSLLVIYNCFYWIRWKHLGCCFLLWYVWRCFILHSSWFWVASMWLQRKTINCPR